MTISVIYFPKLFAGIVRKFLDTTPTSLPKFMHSMRTNRQRHFKNYAGFIFKQSVFYLCTIVVDFKVEWIKFLHCTAEMKVMNWKGVDLCVECLTRAVNRPALLR